MYVGPLTLQKGHGLHAVAGHVHMDGPTRIAERFLGQPNISRTVFDQKNFYRATVSSDGFHDFSSFSARAKRNVEPCPGWDSTEMLPPCRSTIFLQMANPMPVPSNSSRLCSRWNISNIFSKYWESMPIPLSCTENVHFFPPFLEAEIWTRGIPGLWYLMALP